MNVNKMMTVTKLEKEIKGLEPKTNWKLKLKFLISLSTSFFYATEGVAVLKILDKNKRIKHDVVGV